MDKLHVVNLYYQPTEEAKKCYDQMKSALFVASPTAKLDMTDEWCAKNVVLETCEETRNLNQHWCELTAFYELWKKILPKTDCKWIQFSHYRKILNTPSIEQCDINKIYVAPQHPMLFNQKSTDGNGGIVKANVEQGTLMCHPKTSWELLHNRMMDTLNWRDVYLWNDWKSLPYMPAPMNLFMMSKELFMEYCEWLFPVVFDLEKQIPYDSDEYKTEYQRRAIAFIGERLFSFWCWKQACSGQYFECMPVEQHEDWKPMTDEQERQTKLNEVK